MVEVKTYSSYFLAVPFSVGISLNHVLRKDFKLGRDHTNLKAVKEVEIRYFLELNL